MAIALSLSLDTDFHLFAERCALRSCVGELLTLRKKQKRSRAHRRICGASYVKKVIKLLAILLHFIALALFFRSSSILQSKGSGRKSDLQKKGKRGRAFTMYGMEQKRTPGAPKVKKKKKLYLIRKIKILFKFSK